MPLGYGSNIKLNGLSSGDVGVISDTTSSKSSGLDTFLRILLTVAEVGAALIPGVGVIAETGIALAAGVGNEILDVKNNNASITGGLLNFGAPLIGGGFSALNNIRQVGRLGRNAFAAERAALETLESGSAAAQGASQGVYKTFSGAQRLGERVESIGGFSRFNRGLSNFPRGAISNSFGEVGAIGNAFTRSTVKGSLAVGDNAIAAGIEDKRFASFVARSGLSILEQQELFSLLRNAKNLNEERSLLISFIRGLDAQRAIRLFEQASGTAAIILKSEAKQLPLARLFAEEYDKIAADSLIFGAKVQQKSFMKRFVRMLGSERFNQKVVQRGQAIFDPNDLGRAPIEHLYQLLKNKIGKYIAKASKTLKEFDRIEDAFIKSGGILVDSSWHLGYKVVKDLGVNKQIIMISFKNGKRPVLVAATDFDIERYIASPGHYYIKTWALSKGGKNLGLNKVFSVRAIGGIGKEAAQLLPFINVAALKNVLSLVSNIVENTSSMVDGTYFNTYESHFIGSLKRSAISRTFRLAGNVVGGGIAKQIFGKQIGRFIGAELQRVGTQVIAKGINNVTAGKSFTHGMSGKTAATMIATSARSNLLRGLRARHPNSAVAATLSARRKLYQVKRIPNAVVPGRPFKGIKI